MNAELLLGETIVNKYKIEEVLGRGEFGTVFKGADMKSKKTVAIKIESMASPVSTLLHETTIMIHLYNKKCRCIPSIYWYGKHNDLYNCIVMQHYVCSLHEYSLNKTIPHSVLGEIMCSCIDILSYIHNAFVVHRDIKPQNFMISSDKKLHLIDFGMATFYVNEHGNPISRPSDNEESRHKCIVGSPRYASYYIHCGMPPERRDDLISLGYMYLFLSQPKLSWDDFQMPANVVIETPGVSRQYSEIDIRHPKNVERKHKKQLNHLIPEIQRIIYNEDATNITRYMEYCYNLRNTTTPYYDALCDLFST